MKKEEEFTPNPSRKDVSQMLSVDKSVQVKKGIPQNPPIMKNEATKRMMILGINPSNIP